MNFEDFVLKQEWYTAVGHEFIETTYQSDIPLWVKKSDYQLSIENVKSFRNGKVVYESIVHVSEVKAF